MIVAKIFTYEVAIKRGLVLSVALVLFASSFAFMGTRVNAQGLALTSISQNGSTFLDEHPSTLKDVTLDGAGYTYAGTFYPNVFGVTQENEVYTNTNLNVPSLTDIKKVYGVANGINVGIAIKNDNTIWSWGNGTLLGRQTTLDLNGNNEADLEPGQIVGLPTIVDVEIGYYHVLALDENGHVWTWGSAPDGQLGLDSGMCDAATDCRAITPVMIPGLNNVKQISTSPTSSLAVMSDGSMRTWGTVCTTETNWPVQHVPTAYAELSNIKQAVAGHCTMAALTNDGLLYKWGVPGVIRPITGQQRVYFTTNPCDEETGLCDETTKIESIQMNLPNGKVAARDTDGNGYVLGNARVVNASSIDYDPVNLGNIGLQTKYFAGINSIVTLGESQAPVLAAPANLTIFSPTNKPNLNWESVQSADGYRIYRDGVAIGNSSATNYVDSAASNGVHGYYVTALGASVESGPSNTASVLVDSIRPTINFTSPTSFTGPFATGPTISVNAADPGSGLKSLVAHVYKSNNQLLTTCGSANSAQLAAGSMSCSLASLPSGSYYIKAGTFDNAGNNKTIVSSTFTVGSN